MTKVRITNTASFSREVQRYRVNQYYVLKPQESIDFNVANVTELNYYKNLESYGFKVDEIVVEDKKENTDFKENEVVKEVETKVDNTSKEEEVITEEDYSQYTDDQLKQVLYSLGNPKVNRISARWRIENEVRSSLPEGKTVSDYL